MSVLDGLMHQLRVWRHRAQYERDLGEEVRFHLDLDAEQQRPRAADGAAYVARRRFGNRTAVVEETVQSIPVGRQPGSQSMAFHAGLEGIKSGTIGSRRSTRDTQDQWGPGRREMKPETRCFPRRWFGLIP